MVSIFIQIAAALSQRENEAGLYRLEHFSQRLDRAPKRNLERLTVWLKRMRTYGRPGITASVSCYRICIGTATEIATELG